MSSLTIYASGKRVVVWDGTSAWQPDSGQFLLNFETKQNTEAHSAHGATAKRPVKAEVALTWFERTIGTPGGLSGRSASGLSGDRPRTAGFVEAHANLGLLGHHIGHLNEAETCYRRALPYGPDSALAHFNLAVVLEAQEDTCGSLAAYQEALKRAPNLREAHCNLAQLYEQFGRRIDSIRH
jgi:tetratricopeptide (TPR) repeat protein